MKPNLKKFQGCLLGLAIGDAMGMPFEGWRPHWIRRKVGNRLDTFLPAPRRRLKPGMWTDDTKMALHLAESIVRCKGRIVGDDVARSYLAWFMSGDLRGIGGATLQSMTRLNEAVPWDESGKTGSYAAGNGTAMRTAPIGLADCADLDHLREDSRIDAIITHNNEEAIAGSRAVNFFIARGVTAGRTKPTLSLIDEAIEFIGPCKLADRLAKAKLFLKENLPAETALSRLGTSGYVVETVASAVFCFLRTPGDFVKTVSTSILAGGDTDTTGAVAGAISGAWNGTTGIPKHLRDGVEDSRRIREIAGEIHKFTHK